MEGHLGRQLLVVLILILVNAFFAAAEIAVISLNDVKVRHDAEEGDKRAAKLLKLVDKPTQFLSTIQIAITLAGFMASAFAADTFSDRLVHWLVQVKGSTIPGPALNTICLIAITLILSYFTLVLGELVPKRIAMAQSQRVTALTSDVVLAAGTVFRPFVWLLTVSTNGLLRLLRIDPNAANEDVSEEGIRLMVDIGEEKGAIETSEKEMIENIFEFNNITAEDIMVHRKDMVVVWLDDTHEEIMKTITDSGLSRFPVFGETVDDVRGVLRTREYLLNAQTQDPKPLLELVAPAYLVPETVAADDLFRDMQSRKEHIAIVVDEYGGTSGLVTLEDLLEEIVGNIYDEFDPAEENELQELKDGWWRVSGGCEIEALRDVIGLDLDETEEDEFDTLGGLIFSCMNEIPADGSTPALEAYGLEIQVEKIADRRVQWAKVKRQPREEAEEE